MLQFNPPKDLIDSYLNRPSPGQQVSEGIQTALQTYAQQKAAQQQGLLAQQAKDIEMAKGLSQGGQDFQTALDQIKAGRMAPQTAQGPSLIDRAKAFFTGSKTGASPSSAPQTASAPGMPEFQPPTPNPMATPGYAQNERSTQAGIAPAYASAGTPDVPTINPQTDPLVQEYQKDPLAFKRQHGTEGVAKLKGQAELDKLLTAKPEDKYYSTDAATKILKNNPNAASVISAFPKDQVPRDTVHLMMADSKRTASIGSTDWDSASPLEQSMAKAVYEGRMRPSDVGFKERGVIVGLAQSYADKNNLAPFKAYAADVNAAMGKYSTSGKGGQNATSLNTALGHAGSALEAYQNVANTDQRWLNVPINKLRSQTNDPNVLKLQTTLNALGGELATTFKGSGGTDTEIAHWMNVLNENLTPKQAVGVISQVNDLLKSRLSALDYQRNSAGGGTGAPILSPHASELSQRLQGNQASGPHGPTVTQNGHTYTWNGTTYE